MENPLLETRPKDEQEAEEVENGEQKTTGSFSNHLGPKTRETELRLGFSVIGFDENVCLAGKGCKRHPTKDETLFEFTLQQQTGGFGAKRWFSDTEDVFQNQRKSRPKQEENSAFQLNHQQIINPSPPAPRAPSVVGWPPVRAFRRNLAPLPKAEMGSKAAAMSLAEVPKKSEDSMYVKVNMEGYAVGRKINLKAHDSYETLSQALKKMFDDFSVNYSKNPNGSEEEEIVTPNHVLIYEDNEGDRMLVGDVPWEMFINSVKRLYIISGCRAPSIVAGRESTQQRVYS